MAFLAGCSGDESATTAASSKVETTAPVAQPATMPETTGQAESVAAVEKVEKVVEEAAPVAEKVQSEVKTAAISGSKIFETCVGCHGASGGGGVGPKLSGQAEDALIASLTDYKAGKEKGPLSSMMIPMATPLSTEEIKAVAEYITGL